MSLFGLFFFFINHSSASSVYFSSRWCPFSAVLLRLFVFVYNCQSSCSMVLCFALRVTGIVI